MAQIMQTTLKPSKLEIITQWMRAQPWYRGAMSPALQILGGFRLDDPDGEVGLEFFLLGDADGETYFVPLTYRAAPLRDGESENHLVGTMEHGILGTRYVYDGPADPVWRAVVAALLDGEAEPQHRTESETSDRTVRLVPGTQAPAVIGAETVVRNPTAVVDGPGVAIPWEGPDGEVRGLVLRGVEA